MLMHRYSKTKQKFVKKKKYIYYNELLMFTPAFIKLAHIIEKKLW